MSVSRPEAVRAPPSRCRRVASANVASNQRRTNGRKSGTRSLYPREKLNLAWTRSGFVGSRRGSSATRVARSRVRAVDSPDRARLDSAHFPAPTGGAMTYAISRRKFLTTTAAGAALLGRAPAALGQQVREIQVWHTEVEAQTVKMIQDTSIAEFEKKFPGFKIKQQALGWGDLNTKLLAALAAGSPPDLTHLNPFMTASLYRKGLLRP